MIDLSKQKLLVIAPHPDDESLGCAGLIQKIKESGGEIHLLVFTVGNIQQYGSISETNTRVEELKKVVQLLNINSYKLTHPGDQFHLRLDTVPKIELINTIEKEINELQPTMIAFPSSNDTNQDHQAISDAAFTACRPRPQKTSPKIILSYELPTTSWSQLTNKPNFYVDITNQFGKKIQALKLYSSQNHPSPDPRSIEAVETLAKLRGNEICSNYAEAFTLHRQEN